MSGKVDPTLWREWVSLFEENLPALALGGSCVQRSHGLGVQRFRVYAQSQ